MVDLKMGLVDAVPDAHEGRNLSPEVVAILKRAEALKDSETLRVEGLCDGGPRAIGRLATVRKRGFNAVSRKMNGSVVVFIWRKKPA